MDAITLLKNDHKTVEKLFKQFEKSGAGAFVAKRDLVDRMIKELSVHAVIEEQVFYPAIREQVSDANDMVLEALEEHHVAKQTLAELERMAPDHERFTAKVTVLIEAIRHHVEEEEGELFPEVRKAMGRKRLGEIGDQMEALKPNAPTRPHPNAPDEPPANVVTNTGAAVVDRAVTAGKEMAERAREILPGG